MNTNPLTHDEIARRAREIWQGRDCSSGCDEAIWLEAEGGGQSGRHPTCPYSRAWFS